MIEFIFEDIEFQYAEYDYLKSVLFQIAEEEMFNIHELTYIFMSDDSLLEVNKKYLAHDYYTDVITFNYNSRRNLSGDVYISIDTINTNAKRFNKTPENEFLRVIFHGLLHLLGYDDKNEKDQEKMTQMEEFCLNKYYEGRV